MDKEKEIGNSDKKRKPRSLSPETIDAITKAASATAIAEYEKIKAQTRQEQSDRRFRNTKFLIKHYREFADYNAHAIYETAQFCQACDNDALFSLAGISPSDNFHVESIRNGVAITRIIVEHIDTMLDVYKSRCEKSPKAEKQRRWRVLQAMYLSSEDLSPTKISEKENSADMIAEKEHISRSQVYDDIDKACEDLTPLLFGLDLTELFE